MFIIDCLHIRSILERLERLGQSKHWMILALMCALSWQAHAAPIQVTGSAQITHGDRTQARELALRQALWNVAQHTQSQLHAVTTIDNGVIQERDTQLAYFPHLKHFTINSETQEGNLLTLQVTAYPLPQQDQCKTISQYQMMVLPPVVRQPEHLQINQINTLPTLLQSNLERKLKENFTLTAAPITLISSDEIPALAKQTHTNFVISLRLDSALAEYRFPKQYAFWEQTSAIRNLSLHVTLHDGFNQSVLWAKGFSFETDWPWDYHHVVALDSSEFVQSRYYQLLQQALIEMTQEIVAKTQCRPFYSLIKSTAHSRVTIPHGSRHGIKPGQIFTAIQHDVDLVVASVSDGHSELISHIDLNLLNLQPNTQLVRKQ